MAITFEGVIGHPKLKVVDDLLLGVRECLHYAEGRRTREIKVNVVDNNIVIEELTDPQRFYQELSRRGYTLVSSKLTRTAQ